MTNLNSVLIEGQATGIANTKGDISFVMKVARDNPKARKTEYTDIVVKTKPLASMSGALAGTLKEKLVPEACVRVIGRLGEDNIVIAEHIEFRRPA